VHSGTGASPISVLGHSLVAANCSLPSCSKGFAGTDPLQDDFYYLAERLVVVLLLLLMLLLMLMLMLMLMQRGVAPNSSC
jgi:hypothetical protein